MPENRRYPGAALPQLFSVKGKQSEGEMEGEVYAYGAVWWSRTIEGRAVHSPL